MAGKVQAMTYDDVIVPALVISHTGQVFPLTQQPVTIGRQPGNSLVLADPEVSGHHATIFWQPDLDIFVIQDLGSTNGTYVNENRVIEPQALSHDDLIRTGNTLMEVKLERRSRPPLPVADGWEPASGAQQPPSQASKYVLPGVIIAFLASIILACLALSGILFLFRDRGVPSVVVQSPSDGTELAVGSEALIQATASGASDITLLEVRVDGSLIATAHSPDAAGRSTLTLSKPWRFVQEGRHTISAVAYTAEGKTSKVESSSVTAVDGSGGIQPSATAPATPTLAATPTPTVQPSAPQIEYFRANPQTINAGQCTTLEWGQVTGASEARIDPDLEGVAAPGSSEVCPLQTATYTMTATGPGGTTTATTTVVVQGELADLIVEAVGFAPDPPVQGVDTEVRITIRNVGPGRAGPFNWDWRAGQEARFDGRLGGLDPGQATIVAGNWNPSNADAGLLTVARVDTNSEVPETDKDNNQLARTVEVLPGAVTPGTLTVKSDPDLDGYRGNTGGGGTGQDILAGNGDLTGPAGEKVWRGFMSFDLSGFPAGASVEGAELRFFQAKVEGSPYQKLGNLVLEHVNYGSSLGRPAFDVPALGSMALSPQPASSNWYVVAGQDLAGWIEQDLAAGQGLFQVRLRWAQETDGDGLEDYASIEPGNNYFGTGNVPVLVIEYGP